MKTIQCYLAALVVLATSSNNGGIKFVHSFALPTTEIVSTAQDVLNTAQSLPDPMKGAAILGLTSPIVIPNLLTVSKSIQQINKDKKQQAVDGKSNKSNNIVSYPEGQAATYEMNENIVPFEFGDAAFVRPLLKQTQLETRPLQVVYDANRDGYDAKTFHSKVDGKGAAIVLCKVAGQWCGGYNPRGWASLGQARSSVAAFLFYKQPLKVK